MKTRPAPWILRALLLCLAACPQAAAGEASPSPPRLRVRGYGWRGNRELQRSLAMLDTDEDRAYYDASFVEDAAFILLAILRQDGFLNPAVRVRLALDDGGRESYLWRTGGEVMVRRPARAVSVQYRVEPGVLFHYKELDFTGLERLDEQRARSYFLPTDLLLPLKSVRAFTPGRLERSMSNLRDALAAQGYKNAQVTAREVSMDNETGEVRVTVHVREGARHVVRRMQQDILYEDREEIAAYRDEDVGAPYTRRWVQDTTIAFRNALLRRGYPDARIDVHTREEAREDADRIGVDLLFRAATGPGIELDAIVFQGAEKTRESVLRRRVDARPGELLDRLELEHARYRLARLGVFDSVSLELRDAGPGRRTAVFELEEGDRVEASLLLGYGSYEMLRGGLEVAQYNVFGRAHRSRLKAIQSMKSTLTDYTYTMPEVFRRDIDAFAGVAALRRREIDFLRTEYGGSAGLRTYSTSLDSHLSIRYSHQSLESGRLEDVERYGMKRATAGSVVFDISHDRRDNPIFPRSGHQFSGAAEAASEVLSGDSNYQRLELDASWHQGAGRGVYFHLGFRHALVNPSGSVRSNLPFNKRFFPGGDSSVRGYRHGGASPKDEDQQAVGAETYSLLNLELEQIITPSWSLVVFADGLAMAGSIRRYPGDETLYSVGGGVRYRTFMGPLRVEYGHNPSRRSGDPSGTLHVSLGFPF